ncbi:MAG: hypothetical protein Q4F11_02515 [Eubacteriales bacterium]|nr:hypothetical protein [Eubacteriales bacterium]
MAEISLEALKDVNALEKLPILTLDERWYHLITDKNKTDEIKYWEKQLNDLLKKQGQTTNDIKEVKKIKAQLIQDVVDNMEDNDDKTMKKMSQNQRLIQEAKDKIQSLEDESMELPGKISKANQQLMIETAKACYNRMNRNKQDIEELGKWIDAARLKLKKNMLIKQDKEDVNTQIYSYMHDIFGAQMIEELDKLNEQ